MDGNVNTAQAERWNGAGAQHWIAHRQRHSDIREGLTPHLLRGAAIRPGDRVLEVGCGCGENAILAAQAAGPTGRVLGVDLSEPMLAVARDLAHDSGLDAGADRVRFQRADAQVYPFDPASFDVVFSSFGVMFFDDPHAAFTNLFTALRPGGRLAFLCWQRDAVNELFGLPQQALAAHDAPVPTDWGLFADPERITSLLAGAGGTDVTAEPIRAPARLGTDVDDVLGYIGSMETYRKVLVELDDDVRARVTASMAERYAARQRPDGVWVEVAAWLVVATRPE